MSGTYGRIEIDTNIIPKRSQVEMLRGVFMLADLNLWAIGRVGPYNFAAKYYAGRARPEVRDQQMDLPVLSVNFSSQFKKRVYSIANFQLFQLLSR